MPNKQILQSGDKAGNVRRANKSDVAVLASLNEPVQELHANLYPSQFKSCPDTGEVAKFFAGLLEAKKHTIGIYEDPDGAAGYIWFEEIERPPSPFVEAGRRLHIHHISVHPDRRGQGIGSALVDWVDHNARAGGISEITADHWAVNVDAHGFFSRERFDDARIVMKRRVAGAE